MLLKLRNQILRLLSFFFSDSLANRIAGLVSRKFVDQLRTAATDEILELLLRAMGLAFCLSRGYRANIRNFAARYVFVAGEGDSKVEATACFEGGKLHVSERADPAWTVRVRFSSVSAVRRFLFGEKQDILQSILANEVAIDGNINYIYKFGFMARDLERRLGVLT